MAIKIELIKMEYLNGKIYFNLKVNGVIEESYLNREQAENEFEKIKIRIKDPYPKTEILKSEII